MSKTSDRSVGKKLDKISKRLDMIVVILLAKSGLKRKEIADILGISEKTIQRMLPFKEIKQTREET
jgi:DNA-binding NarL/FixJ family response regulator